MAKIIFTKDSESFTFIKGRSAPITDALKLNVVTDMTDGGVMYAYDKGIGEQFFDLSFRGMKDIDITNVLDWFTNVSVGAKNEFVFTDEEEVEHTVRWVDEIFAFVLEEDGTWTGTIRLREEV